jgi:hypothetical protein
MRHFPGCLSKNPASVWAWAVVKTIAAHNSVAVRSFVLTAVGFPAGFFIALPCSVSCSSTKDCDDARQTLPLQPHWSSLIPEQGGQIAPHRSTPVISRP